MRQVELIQNNTFSAAGLNGKVKALNFAEGKASEE